jgi:hypothetical protein
MDLKWEVCFLVSRYGVICDKKENFKNLSADRWF